MTDLIKDVQLSVKKELARAAEKFGAKNNSDHESYAVILEEYEEARCAFDAFEWNLRSYWCGVKANTATKSQLQQCRRIAEEAAAEMIQVAAMCLKAEATVRDTPFKISSLELGNRLST